MPSLGSSRAVLYTHDLEPITVLQLTPQARSYLLETGQVALAVREPFTWDGREHAMCRTVRITAEVFCRRRQRSLMLFTEDEEAALLLQAAFLPGQQRELNERRDAAFARGFLAAIDALGM